MLIYEIADYAVAERARALPAEAVHWAKRAVIDWCATTAPGAIEMPATGCRMGTPAAISPSVVLQTLAIELDPFDSVISEMARMV